MAGHSQWKNIMYRKGAQDAKRAKLFGKLIRELTVAARSGLPDPNKNPRLRNAIAAARGANMPKETVERAIKRGAGASEGAGFEEIRYEGYAPGGVALIVEALTDNRNRTAAEIRAAFSRCGGSLGEPGSVNYLFERVGSLHYAPEAATADEMFEAALEAGADDCTSDEEGHEITCAPERFNEVRDALEKRFGAAQRPGLTWKPQATIPVGEAQASSLLKLLETLDGNDDVQQIAANYEIPDEVWRRLTA